MAAETVMLVKLFAADFNTRKEAVRLETKVNRNVARLAALAEGNSILGVCIGGSIAVLSIKGCSKSHFIGEDGNIRVLGSENERFLLCDQLLLNENVDSLSVSSEGIDSIESDRTERKPSLCDLFIISES